MAQTALVTYTPAGLGNALYGDYTVNQLIVVA